MNDPRSLHSLPPEGADQRPSGGRAGAEAVDKKKVRVTLVKSVNGTREDHRATVKGLGLKWTNHSVLVEDTPSTRGMINKVGYLLKVTDANA